MAHTTFRMSQHEEKAAEPALDPMAVDEKVPPEESDDSNLRRVPGSISWILLLCCFLEFAERFVWWGISAPLQNYIQRPYGNPSKPGALGGGQSLGVALGDFLKFWAYVSTVWGAVIADRYLGKYKTILVASPIYIAGLVIIIATATPAAIEGGHALGGLVTGMILVGFGTGLLKACIAPLCGEQGGDLSTRKVTLKSGEVVIQDGKMTTARIFMWYYWAGNLGALAQLMTVAIETRTSAFWTAWLLPLALYLTALTIVVVLNKKIHRVAPKGSPIVEASKTAWVGLREGGLDKATPSSLQARDRLRIHTVTANEWYTDEYVGQVKEGLVACKYFLLLPFFFVCYTQIFTNLVAQAGTMRLGGTPNDLMQSLEIIFMLTFIPILDLLIYPTLRKWNISFSAVNRIFCGFMLMSISMTYACVLQHYIYSNPPASIFVWIQAPAYIFSAIAEIFVVITGLEVAFIKAPDNLKVFVSSMFWVSLAVGSLIGIGLSPVSKDPNMLWVYGALAITVFTSGLVFIYLFHGTTQDTIPDKELDVKDGLPA
ncbi:POT family protein [Thozetella sp. PMI_491]|nr:POT family protein [Thozetella sp. PMI_491]